MDTLQLKVGASMSGAHIQADKPLAVFSGNEASNAQGTSEDHMVEQIPPMNTWGKVGKIYSTHRDRDKMTADLQATIFIFMYDKQALIEIITGLLLWVSRYWS